MAKPLFSDTVNHSEVMAMKKIVKKAIANFEIWQMKITPFIIDPRNLVLLKLKTLLIMFPENILHVRINTI